MGVGETTNTDLFLLNRLVDEERRTERGLLRDLRKDEDVMRMRSAAPNPPAARKTRATHLFCLDGVCELGREGDVRDRDVVEYEIKA